MKSILLIITFSLITFKASAEVKSFCTVTNIKIAQQCMDRVAGLLPEYEEPNESVVAKNNSKIEKLFLALDMPNTVMARLRAADYVGAVLMHGDEHELIYFSMKKGSRGIPKEIASINLVDLESMLIDNNVAADDLFLGHDARNFDVYQDVVEAIEAANEH